MTVMPTGGETPDLWKGRWIPDVGTHWLFRGDENPKDPYLHRPDDDADT